MTAAAKTIIETFEALGEFEKSEVLAELIRIAPYPRIAEEELLAVADEVFLDYDRRERDA